MKKTASRPQPVESRIQFLKAMHENLKRDLEMRSRIGEAHNLELSPDFHNLRGWVEGLERAIRIMTAE